MIKLFCLDECNSVVCVCDNCHALELSELSREEKSILAKVKIEKCKEEHPEFKNFWYEKKACMYHSEDELFNYFWDIATEEEGLEGEEAEAYAEKCVDEEIKAFYDLGFDY